MSGNLHRITQEVLRHLLGNMTFNSGVLAIDGTNAENVQTGATIEYSIKGIHYSRAAIAEIDISTLAGLPATALAVSKTQIFGFELDSAGVVSVVAGLQVPTADITSGDRELDWPVASTTAKTVFGAVRVDNASSAVFTIGTTDLSAAGITDTYFNLSVSSF